MRPSVLNLVLALAALTGIAVGGVIVSGSHTLARDIHVPAHRLDLRMGDAATGQRLATLYMCTTCHGGSLGGNPFLQEMPFFDLPAPNLTGGRYTPDEFERAIRHGVGSDGRALVIMPSQSLAHLSDRDVASIVAYIQGIAPVDFPLNNRQVGVLGRAAAAFRADELMGARTIDHGRAHFAETPALDGAYLVATCRFCHGDDLGGSTFIAAERLWAPNLTAHPTGMGGWDVNDFSVAVRTGISRDGASMDADHMPWRAFAVFTDSELRAMWDYLRTVPLIDRSSPDDRGAIPG